MASRMRSRASIAGAAIVVSALAGCTGASGAPPTPGATVTVTATATVTPAATPTPAAAAPDDPVTPLAAWHACAVLGLREYLAQAEGAKLTPYDASKAPTRNEDGTYDAIVGFTPPPGTSGGVVALCTIGGTLGQPTLVRFTLKDI